MYTAQYENRDASLESVDYFGSQVRLFSCAINNLLIHSQCIIIMYKATRPSEISARRITKYLISEKLNAKEKKKNRGTSSYKTKRKHAIKFNFSTIELSPETIWFNENKRITLVK